MYPNSVEADGVVAPALPPTNGSAISTSPEQPEKAPLPIFVTESGTDISLMPVQLRKAKPPIVCTPSLIFTDTSFVQFSNAYGLMSAHDISTDERDEHPLKQYPPILVTSSSRITVVSDEQFSNSRPSTYPTVMRNVVNAPLSIDAAAIAGIVALVICVQPANASSPIDVRFFDKVTEVRLTQSLNVLAPILVTVSGTTSVCMAVLPLNASSLIATTVPLL